MKKLVFSLAVLFSVAMVSCGGNKTTEAADSDTLVVVEEAVEVVADSNDTAAVAEVAAEVAEVPADSRIGDSFIGIADSLFFHYLCRKIQKLH